MRVPSQFLSPEVLDRLAGLSLKARHVVEGVLTGLHRSSHHGASIEFSEHKEYSPGDDIRHIDWKAFGRFDKYYVKQFEQETNLQGYLLVDASASMSYKSPDARWSKQEYACVLASCLAYLLLRQQDAAGILTFAEGPQTYVPPRSTSGHLLHITGALEALEAKGGTDIVLALERVAEIARRRAAVFLFSDMFDTSPQVLARLKQLRSRRLDVVVFHILDPWELSFPFEDMTEFEDIESPEQRLLVDPRGIRDAYLEEFRSFVDGVRRDCFEADVDCLTLTTDTPPDKVLLELLRGRR